jgi:hypothetical protein
MNMNHIGVIVKNVIVDYIDENMEISDKLSEFLKELRNFIGSGKRFWHYFRDYKLIEEKYLNKGAISEIILEKWD